MYNDLTKDATIKAFKKVGISVYDASGKIKQADNLMLELNKKFSGLDSDKKVVALKNQFSGSEGLIAMIQAATDKSGQLQSTFNSFSQTKLDMDKTMELAKNDLNYKNEIMRNKLETLEIEIGTSLLPLKYKIAELKLAVIELANSLILGEGEKKKRVFSEGWTKQQDEYEGTLKYVEYISAQEYKKKHDELLIAMNVAKDVYIQSIGNTTRTPLPWGGKSLWSKERQQQYKEEWTGYSSEYTRGKYEAAKNMFFDFQKQWQTKTNFGRNVLKPDDTKKTDTTTTTTPPGGSSSLLGDDVGTVVGSAKQVRNFTVNIDSFVKGGINTANTTLKNMEPQQMEELFTDLFMRVIRSVKTSY